MVSIPSNGSIQFLYEKFYPDEPAKESQSPLTGQFNFYSQRRVSLVKSDCVSIPSNGSIQFLSQKKSQNITRFPKSLNPL